MRIIQYASVGVPLPVFLSSFLSFVIAGLDPAIHAAAKPI
jgi:hypothetical protein